MRFPRSRGPRGTAYKWGISPAQALWAVRHVAEFDVVHVHGVWGPGQISALAAANLIGKPIVVTAHESLTAFNIDISKSSARRRQKLLVKWLYLRCTTLFLLNSELEAADSLPASASQRTVHFPQG